MLQPDTDAFELARQVVRSADRRGVRLATAESLTGGLLAATIVAVPGASRVFSGGVVAYDTSLKASLLEVDPELLASLGPVDPEVARQMARGVRRACAVSLAQSKVPTEAHFGISTTGVAGPDPDPQTGQPAGTVWLGLSSELGERASTMRLEGDRQSIREATVRSALQTLLQALAE
ncbi:CinA family protein [Leucobacter sp. W1153]|uniref:CinA family protein n=1 Tax=unclassified Leucobacter TaxID=2621730 RepID=UPI003F3AC200